MSFLTGFLKHLATEGGASWRQNLGKIHLKGIDKVAPNHSPARSVQGAEIAFQVAGKNHVVYASTSFDGLPTFSS